MENFWDVTTQLFRLPFETVRLSAGVMVRLFPEVQKVAGAGLKVATGGGLRAKPGSMVPLAPPPLAATTSGRSPPAADPRIEVNSDAGVARDAEDRHAGVPQDADTPTKEERKMSACDQDLSGDDVKVVQYTILSNESNINDNNRILINPPLQVVAFSDDMTADGFVSWVIAKDCDKLKDNNPKNIRVCFCVMCRVPKEDDDCCQDQAYELRRIANHLIGGGNSLQPAGGSSGHGGDGGDSGNG